MPKTTIFKNSISLALLICIAACNTLETTKSTEPVTRPTKEVRLPSAAPLESVSERDVLFAQAALNQLGYRAGVIDGMWGSQSANAMRAFEQKEKIESANGKLSALNLYRLSKTAKVLRSTVESKTKSKANSNAAEKPNSLVSKLDISAPLSSAPQLIILDAPYPVLAKANPYSEVVTTLKEGTGVYVLARQGEWFEIESLEQQRGFIKENP